MADLCPTASLEDKANALFLDGIASIIVEGHIQAMVSPPLVKSNEKLDKSIVGPDNEACLVHMSFRAVMTSTTQLSPGCTSNHLS